MAAQYTGVRKAKNSKSWSYRVTINTVRIEHGGYSTAEAAHKAREAYITAHPLCVANSIIRRSYDSVISNRKRGVRNATGHIGIKHNGNRYSAKISVCGNEIYLGSYPTLAMAVAARESAERTLHDPLIAAVNDSFSTALDDAIKNLKSYRRNKSIHHPSIHQSAPALQAGLS